MLNINLLSTGKTACVSGGHKPLARSALLRFCFLKGISEWQKSPIPAERQKCERGKLKHEKMELHFPYLREWRYCAGVLRKSYAGCFCVCQKEISRALYAMEWAWLSRSFCGVDTLLHYALIAFCGVWAYQAPAQPETANNEKGDTAKWWQFIFLQSRTKLIRQ